METSRDANHQLAGTQVPLLNENQLVPGVLLAGVAGSFVWQVLSIEGRDLLIQKLPTINTPCSEHRFAAFGRGQVCSACNVRKQGIVDFMPKVANKARVHVITPASQLMQPMPHTLYGYLLPSGQAKLISVNNLTGAGNQTWSEVLPIVPKLGVVWAIPENLRALIEAHGSPLNPTPDPLF